MFRTAVHCFLFFIRLRNDLKGNKNYFELAAASSYQGFELPRVNYSKCMKENGKRGNLLWFELAKPVPGFRIGLRSRLWSAHLFFRHPHDLNSWNRLELERLRIIWSQL